jgi:hypothetical protein
LQVRPATTSISEKTGQHTVAFSLVNASAHVCLLRGYPSVVLHIGKRVLPFTITHKGDQMITDQPPAPVALQPHAAAWVLLNTYRCDLGDRAFVTDVELDGLHSALPRRVLAWCGPASKIAVSPFEPTQNAAIRIPPCVPAQLRLRAAFKGAAAGQFVQTLTLTNDASSCELWGWPAVRGAATKRVLQRGKPSIVTLGSGGAASFDLYGEDYDHLRQRTCPILHSLVVDHSLHVRVDLPHCGTWYLAPYVAGRSDHGAWSRVVGR